MRTLLLRVVQQCMITPLYFRYPLGIIDLNYLRTYWNKNPYQICKQYFQSECSQEMFYGDTWPMSAFRLIKAACINQTSTLFDVGSGTGRIAFWFQAISRCQVIAIEKIPLFNHYAKQIQKRIKNAQIEFVQDDFLEIDYQKATHIYFYGSTYEDETILKLINRWQTLNKGTIIITPSFSLKDYGFNDYQIIRTLKLSFPWGRADVYIQEKTV